MPWPTDDLEYDAPDTVPSNPAREGFSAGARKPWRQGIYNLVAKVKAILAQHGAAGGIATLDDNRKLPLDQLPPHPHVSSQAAPHTHSQYMLASSRGAANGVASLDGNGDVPAGQLGNAHRILLAYNGTNGPLLPLRYNRLLLSNAQNICRVPDDVFVLLLLGYQWGNNRHVRSSILYKTGGSLEFYQLPTGSRGNQDSLQIGLIRGSDGYLKGGQNYPNDNAGVRVAAVVQLS